MSWMLVVVTVVISFCAMTVESRSRKKAEEPKTAQQARSDEASKEDCEKRAEEAELVLTTVMEQNEQLEKELTRVGDELRDLSVTLAEVTAELDVLRVQRDQAWVESVDPIEAGVVSRVEWVVLDANEELNMVVLDGGAEDGILTGMMFTILQDDKAMAQIRVVDARERIAGAVVEKKYAGSFPEKGWRAIVGRAEK